jgi:hypothetical protein
MDHVADLREKRTRAETWVSVHTLVVVVVVLGVSAMPGASALVVWAVEAAMAYRLGRAYRCDDWMAADVQAVPRLVGWGELLGPAVILEAAGLLGAFAAPWVKATIAAAVVKRLGVVVIAHLEGLAPKAAE